MCAILGQLIEAVRSGGSAWRFKIIRLSAYQGDVGASCRLRIRVPSAGAKRDTRAKKGVLRV